MTARRPVLLLGASNLTIGWRPLLRALRRCVVEPVNMHVALGMGRSYCDWSGFWLRWLPGISTCGLWNNLPRDDSPAPLVLMTDIGNDIVYRLPPPLIAEHVQRCLDQILEWRADAKVVITGLPLMSVNAITRPQFLIARTILFPMCFLSLKTIQQRSADLDDRVRRLADQYQLPIVTPAREWYGHDPIHVLRELRESVFMEYFSHWQVPTANLSREDGESPPLPIAALRRVCCIPRRRAQPGFESARMSVSAW